VTNVGRWHSAFGLAMFILVGTAGIYYSRQVVPTDLVRPLSALPLHIGDWAGEPADRQVSPFHLAQVDSELVRLYRNASGDSFGLYIAHVRNQDGKKKLVDFQSYGLAQHAEPIAVSMSGTSPSPRINRAFLSRNGRRWVVYYWFDINDRIVSSRYMAKVYILRDALWDRRTDGTLVMLFRDPGPLGQGGGPSPHEMALLRSVLSTVHGHLSSQSKTAAPAQTSAARSTT
jgi:EpsI family protein